MMNFLKEKISDTKVVSYFRYQITDAKVLILLIDAYRIKNK